MSSLPVPGRTRTCNPRLRRPMLYPLSYRHTQHRGRGIRTPDILLPKQARYQTALYPEQLYILKSCPILAHTMPSRNPEMCASHNIIPLEPPKYLTTYAFYRDNRRILLGHIMSSHKELSSMIAELASLLDTHHLNEIHASINGISATVRRDTRPITPMLQHIDNNTPNTTPQVTECPIHSPTVGIFYAKPSPAEKDFVHVGQHVTKDQTVGMIESMKVFYPISAPCSGIVTMIHAQHGSSVEHNQHIMIIQPDSA